VSPGKIVWIIDFAGFAMADCKIRMASSALQLLGAHYPERLGQVMMVWPPKMFNIFFYAVKHVADPCTLSKVRIIRDADALEEYSAKFWQHDPVMAEWILATTRRCKGVPGNFPPMSLSMNLKEKTTVNQLGRCFQSSSGNSPTCL